MPRAAAALRASMRIGGHAVRVVSFSVLGVIRQQDWSLPFRLWSPRTLVFLASDLGLSAVLICYP